MKTAYFPLAVVAVLQCGFAVEDIPCTAWRARVVRSGEEAPIECHKALADLVLTAARHAAENSGWKDQADPIELADAVILTAKGPGPVKIHLGKGFSGLKSIAVEIAPPHRVVVVDAGKIYSATLPADSDVMLGIKAVWTIAGTR